VLFRRGVPSAAIGYLKEAVAGIEADDPNLGVVRHHLAQAYEANGEPEQARETLDAALAAHDARVAEQEAAGASVAEPTWYAEARAMRERL
jgi:hypothetical protein